MIKYNNTTRKFISQITDLGLKSSTINRNLTVKKLIEISIKKKEGIITKNNSFSVVTGKYTGRSPDDRYIVYDDETNNTVTWGKINHKFTINNFNKIPVIFMTARII